MIANTIIERCSAMNDASYYQNEAIKNFNRLFNINLTDKIFSYTKLPIIMIDLAPRFNIVKFKYEFADEYINKIYSEFSDYYIYRTYVYKQPITKKISIDEEEFVYDSLVRTAEEIEYLLGNVLRAHKSLILYLGRYKEYSYLKYFLQRHFIGNGTVLNFVSIRHYSNYSKYDYNLDDNKYFVKDIESIKKNIQLLEKRV